MITLHVHVLFACTVVETALVRSPVNTAVTQESQLTLHCTSDGDAFIEWHYCKREFDAKTCDAGNIFIYNGFGYVSDALKFSVVEATNATHVRRDLNINSTQLADAGVYRCQEHIPGQAGPQQSRSAQLIVLGKFTADLNMNTGLHKKAALLIAEKCRTAVLHLRLSDIWGLLACTASFKSSMTFSGLFKTFKFTAVPGIKSARSSKTAYKFTVSFCILIIRS